MTPPNIPTSTEESGWQPIETAPKDGTRFLLATPDTVMVGHWSQRLLNFQFEAKHHSWQRDKITHWMPLPLPPGSERTQGEKKNG